MKRIILTIIVLFSFMLINANMISGHTNLLDSPVEGAILELYTQQPGMGLPPIEITTSNEDGFYSFNITLPGWYFVGGLIETPIFQYMFYDNATNPQMATPIHISNMNPNHDEIDFNFQSNIPGGNNSISGLVTDNSSTPIESVQIELIPAQYSSPWWASFFCETDQNGIFSMENLPDGEYLLMGWYPTYFPYFYNGAQFWQQAEVIILENGSAIQIDIVMQSNFLYSITGHVEDALTNQPIIGAMVYVIPHDGHIPGSNGPGGSMMMTPFAITDENGNYELILSEDDYLVMAHDTVTNCVEFYDNAATPLTATWLTLDQNISGIDFVLNENLGGDYSVSGTLSISSNNPNPPVPMLAVAVSSDEDWEETVAADSGGGYIIPDLPGGEYYVYGFSPIAIPTYFEDAINYEEAILLDIESNLNGIDIELQTAQENGYLACSGFVLDDTGEPVSNVTVAFVDPFGNVQDYAYTDALGEYEIPSLGSLNYTAIATKTFYETDEVQLPINGNQSWNFTIIDPDTYSEQQLIDTHNMLEVNSFPNPFNPQTTIRFSLPHFAEETEISIFNIKGQKVYHKMLVDLAKGSYAISWLAKDEQNKSLGSGVYFLRIHTENYTNSAKLLLLK